MPEDDNVVEDYTWHCECGAMGKCKKEDADQLHDLHILFECLSPVPPTRES